MAQWRAVPVLAGAHMSSAAQLLTSWASTSRACSCGSLASTACLTPAANAATAAAWSRLAIERAVYLMCARVLVKNLFILQL